MYYNPALLVATLNKMGDNVFAHFVQQWIHDTDCFIGLHDRKVKEYAIHWDSGLEKNGFLTIIRLSKKRVLKKK